MDRDGLSQRRHGRKGGMRVCDPWMNMGRLCIKEKERRGKMTGQV